MTVSGRPVVVAHRGASGYLPEHTLPGKALAHGMGADFLEQDVVASSDSQLLVFHDLHLDQLTDVGRQFPGRARPDGRHYCIDFSLQELRTLTVTERQRRDGSGPRFPARFPANTGSFRIPTLEEELDLIQGLNRSTGRRAGVYAEIKAPGWHTEHRFGLGDRLLETLRAFGYRTAADGFFVQCFCAAELRRVRARYGGDVPLIQLLDDAGDVSREALAAIAGYAQGIGPTIGMAWPDRGLVSRARESGLLIHPYTFRADDLPEGFRTFTELLTPFIELLEVDGLFTDFPDLVIAHIRQRG